MFKLVAVSTLALSAFAVSIPLGNASQGCPDNTKCGMAFAPTPVLNEALLESAQNSARALALASELAHYGEATQSPAALLVAAQMIGDLNIQPIEGTSTTLFDDENLLAEARVLAADDAIILAMIDDVVAEQDRGSSFDVSAYDGQGGESWVEAGDSALFNRSYDSGTDAVLTLVAAPASNLQVRVVDGAGDLVCEGTLIDGAHSCLWAANAGADYAIQVTNQAETAASFTIWTN